MADPEPASPTPTPTHDAPARRRWSSIHTRGAVAIVLFEAGLWYLFFGESTRSRLWGVLLGVAVVALSVSELRAAISRERERAAREGRDGGASGE